jgi:hypothetical protein
MDETARHEPPTLAVEHSQSRSLHEDEDLIDPGVDLLADLSRWQDAHHHHLRVRPGGDHLSEVRITPCPGEDVLAER